MSRTCSIDVVCNLLNVVSVNGFDKIEIDTAKIIYFEDICLFKFLNRKSMVGFHKYGTRKNIQVT